MESDALIFMLLAWGFTLGLLAFCIVMLAKHPQVVSVLTNNFGDNDKDESDTEEPGGPGTDG